MAELSLSKILKDLQAKMASCITAISSTDIKNKTKAWMLSDLKDKSSTSIYKLIKDFSNTNLPMRIGLHGSRTLPITFSGLKATVASQYIYFGGFATKLRAETITMAANATNYIYLIPGDDYVESRIHAYTAAQSANYWKVLVATIKTNASAVTSSTYVSFKNYKND